MRYASPSSIPYLVALPMILVKPTADVYTEQNDIRKLQEKARKELGVELADSSVKALRATDSHNGRLGIKMAGLEHVAQAALASDKASWNLTGGGRVGGRVRQSLLNILGIVKEVKRMRPPQLAAEGAKRCGIL